MGNTFLRGTKRDLLKAVGAAYGYLVVESPMGIQSAMVLSLGQARTLLMDGVKKGFMTPDEAGDMEKTIAAAGLLENFSAIFTKAAEIKVKPSGERQTFFRVCTKPDCSLTKPHGTLVNGDGKSVHRLAFTDSGRGFFTLDRLVCEGTVTANDAVLCFQEMRQAKLAEDEAALTRDSSDEPGGQRVGVTVLDVLLDGRGLDDLLEHLRQTGGDRL